MVKYKSKQKLDKHTSKCLVFLIRPDILERKFDILLRMECNLTQFGTVWLVFTGPTIDQHKDQPNFGNTKLTTLPLSSALCSSPFLHSSPAKMPSLPLPSSPVCHLSSPTLPPPSLSFYAATSPPILCSHLSFSPSVPPCVLLPSSATSALLIFQFLAIFSAFFRKWYIQVYRMSKHWYLQNIPVQLETNTRVWYKIASLASTHWYSYWKLKYSKYVKTKYIKINRVNLNDHLKLLTG